jgi:hypothetical protein
MFLRPRPATPSRACVGTLHADSIAIGPIGPASWSLACEPHPSFVRRRWYCRLWRAPAARATHRARRRQAAPARRRQAAPAHRHRAAPEPPRAVPPARRLRSLRLALRCRRHRRPAANAAAAGGPGSRVAPESRGAALLAAWLRR